MTQKRDNSNYIIQRNVLYGYVKSKFLPTGWFKWINPTKFDLNEYSSNSSKDCGLEFDLEYSKILHDLHNGYPLATDKLEIKKEMLSDDQLKTAKEYNIFISNVKKLVPNFI